MPGGRRRRRRWCPRRPARKPAARPLRCRRGRASVTAPVSGCDIGTSRRHSAVAGSVTPSTHQPPSRAMPSTASASHSADAHSARRSAVTCGVSIPICSTGRPSAAAAASAWALANRSAKSTPRCSSTVKSASRVSISRTSAGGGEIAGERDDAGRHRGGRDGVQGVQQRGRGESAAADVPDARREARLRQPGHRRLGHHQHGHRYHEIARQKSRAAMKLPRTEPLTFDLPPVRGP